MPSYWERVHLHGLVVAVGWYCIGSSGLLLTKPWRCGPTAPLLWGGESAAVEAPQLSAVPLL